MQAETKRYIQEYMVERERLRAIQKEMLEKEEEEIRRHAQMIEEREAKLAEKKRIMDDEKDRIFQQLAEGKMEQQRRREEYETLLSVLHFEESEERYGN